MFKKVLLPVGCILLGLNFGLIAGFSPIILIITMVLFPEDPLTREIMLGSNLICAVATGIGTYIYAYLKKREHETPHYYGMILAISFIVGALLMALYMMITLADPNSGQPSRFI